MKSTNDKRFTDRFLGWVNTKTAIRNSSRDLQTFTIKYNETRTCKSNKKNKKRRFVKEPPSYHLIEISSKRLFLDNPHFDLADDVGMEFDIHCVEPESFDRFI